MIRFLVALLFLAGPAAAVETVYADGAVLRGLDKIKGDVGDIEVMNEGSAAYGRLTVSVSQCRVPRANPSGDAYAFVTIRHDGIADPLFNGWMIASSPALNAFDHHRYDVWLLSCITS